MEVVMNYKGYQGSRHFSTEDGVHFGQILMISDLVMYQSEVASDLEAAFHESVDDYLLTCSHLNKVPDTPLDLQKVGGLS